MKLRTRKPQYPQCVKETSTAGTHRILNLHIGWGGWAPPGSFTDSVCAEKTALQEMSKASVEQQ